jgi:hypothetical protein
VILDDLVRKRIQRWWTARVIDRPTNEARDATVVVPQMARGCILHLTRAKFYYGVAIFATQDAKSEDYYIRVVATGLEQARLNKMAPICTGLAVLFQAATLILDWLQLPIQFPKRRQLFIGVHNVTSSAPALCGQNPELSALVVGTCVTHTSHARFAWLLVPKGQTDSPAV